MEDLVLIMVIAILKDLLQVVVSSVQVSTLRFGSQFRSEWRLSESGGLPEVVGLAGRSGLMTRDRDRPLRVCRNVYLPGGGGAAVRTGSTEAPGGPAGVTGTSGGAGPLV